MKIAASILALAAIALGVQADDDVAVADRALLVVHKSMETDAKNNMLIIGRNFTVTYTAINKGSEPALDVELRDTWPAQNFVKLSGPDVMTWARVEPGQEVSQSVVLQAHTAQEGTFSSSRASVDYTYGEGDDAIDRRAYSSSLGTVRVYTEAGYKRAVQRFTLEWTTFLALGAIVTVLPFVSFTLMRKAAATKAKAA